MRMEEQEKTHIETVSSPHKGIKKQIDQNIQNAFRALNEYLWNCIDANSKNIWIDIELEKEILKGDIKEIEIKDDGNGINYDHLKKETFGVFNQSEKENIEEKHHSIPHGKNGYGRFSFIKFCNSVKWETVYKDTDGENKRYNIKIEHDQLNKYLPSEKEQTKELSGTKVIFSEFHQNNPLIDTKSKNKLSFIIQHIKLEFGWLIELTGINIFINKHKIDLSNLIETKIENEKLKIKDREFNLKVIFWNEKLIEESSRYYFINSKEKETYTKQINLIKINELNVSCYINSVFFDDYSDYAIRKTEEKTLVDNGEIYLELLEELEEVLLKKSKNLRRFLVENKFRDLSKKSYYNDLFVSSIEQKIKKPLFEKATKTIINYSPEIFKKKNDTQNKLILNFIYNSLDNDQSRQILINILKMLVNEENKSNLAELEKQLSKYKLENILGLIKLVEERFTTLEYLIKVIFDKDFYYLESDLQRLIEKEFWIFGEEYCLIGSENDRFKKLLEIYYEKILKFSTEEIKDIKASKKEVDLMISRKDWFGKNLTNTIIEIKKPGITLNTKNLDQIKEYSRIISEINEFNSNGEEWIFILIGNDYDQAVIDEIENKSSRREGLLIDNKRINHKIYVKKWSDILDDVNFRLKKLKETLNLKEERITEEVEKEISNAKGEKQKFLSKILKNDNKN